MRWLGAALAIAVPIVSVGWGPAAAAQYSFSVPKMMMTNVVQPDASVVIEYEIDFANSPWGQAIDVVDIGLPHDGYDISNMEAWLDGEPVTRIAPSTYIDVGVEVQLGLHAIGSGERGTFRFRATVPDLVYEDTTSDELASFRITPTWFDSSLLTGTTDLRIAVQLPPGVEPEAVVYQNVPFYQKAAYNDTTLAGWRFDGTRVDDAHLVGLSFPRASMDRVLTMTKLELLFRWFENSTPARLFAALGVLVLFAVAFFRWSGGTGFSVFFFVMAGTMVLYWFSPRVQLATIPVWIAIAVLMEWRLRRKRTKYLPPLAHVEGGGIKRGLTAPEAAVLLEMPLGRVVTLVIFGMLKKGLLRQVSADPLRVEAVKELAAADQAKRRSEAARLGVVIHHYEHAYLDAIATHAGMFVTDIDFSAATRKLVERVAERMIGFDVGETKDYYRLIVSRAWEMAKGIGEVEQREQHLDRNLEWMLLDDDWSGGFETWGRSGYHYRPIWIRPGALHTGAHGGGLGHFGSALGGGGGGGSGGAHAAPSFGDVAASFAGWTESLTGQMASVISPTQLAVDGGGGKGVVNLSGADHVTGDVLAAFFSGSGGGGGGGGGGGCACAGCACACACAGGGR